MTEGEYYAAVRAEREFGKIQIHQQFRKLALELGLPPECSRPEPEPLPWRPRWHVHQDHQQRREIAAQMRMEAYARSSIQPPTDRFVVTSVT